MRPMLSLLGIDAEVSRKEPDDDPYGSLEQSA